MNAEQKQFGKLIITAVTIGLLWFFVIALLFQPFFTGRVEMPQSFGIGPLRVQFYGLLLGMGSLIGYWLAMRRRVIHDISAKHGDRIILYALVGGFLGARLYHIISEFPYYWQNLSQMIAIWNGGMSIYGAALGGIVAIWIYHQLVLKSNSKNELLNILDWLTPSIIIGQIIGRFGNFVNYELYGSPTALPWKMSVPKLFRSPPFELNQFFHPLFLYEAAGNVIILFILLKLKLRGGRLFFMWLLLYNVMRFFLEFIRVGSVTYGGIRVNAFVSLGIIIIVAFLYYRFYVAQNTSNS